jgi:phosphoesterase RecJ-like protein
VDVSTRERIGAIGGWIAPHHKVVILDHHLNEHPEGGVGFIDHSYAATGEIVCDLFEAAGMTMTGEAAFNACVAQVTDTGGYRFMNTNARSHRIAARFHEAGTDVGGIIREYYETISVPKVKLLRLYLDRMEFRAGGRVAYSWIDAADIQGANGEREDMSGLVNYARNVEGVVVGAIFSMLEPGVTKVSLRSAPEFNAAAFLSRFGGGGHAAAAGATIGQDIKEAMRMVLEALEEALGKEAEA